MTTAWYLAAVRAAEILLIEEAGLVVRSPWAFLAVLLLIVAGLVWPKPWYQRSRR